MNRNTLVTVLALVCQPVAADMNIKFVESAPKDWFAITNSGECAISELRMTIDLNNTTGKLIFDTTAAGEGVEVFQPFEKREGDIELISASKINDGEKALSVLVKSLAPGASASFTIDVDDTLKNSELGNIRVSDAEIKGGSVMLKIDDGEELKGTFDSNGEIILPSPDC